MGVVEIQEIIALDLTHPPYSPVRYVRLHRIQTGELLIINGKELFNYTMNDRLSDLCYGN